MPKPEEIIYKDFPVSFLDHPVTHKLNVVTNAEAVKNSVKNIILTNRFERPYNPFFGGNVTAQLFENADPFTEYNVTRDVRTAIENFEPRAILDNVVVNANPDNHTLDVTVHFRTIAIKDPITVTVNIERVR